MTTYESAEDYMKTFLDGWDSRISIYRALLREATGSKNAMLTRSCLLGVVDMDVVNPMLDEVERRGGDSDFKLISLIRLLCTGSILSASESPIGETKAAAEVETAVRETVLEAILRDAEKPTFSSFSTTVVHQPDIENGLPLEDVKTLIANKLSSFPFWVNGEATKGEFDKMVFWSENHAIMFLSSAHLFHSYAKKMGLSCRCSDREERLLRIYLRAHLSFSGVYEVMSVVYLPYTMSALLNLFDFSTDEAVRSDAKALIDIIVHQLMLCCTDTGVVNLSGKYIFPLTSQIPFLIYSFSFDEIQQPELYR